MTNAIAAKGSQLKRGDAGDPELFSAVAEVRSISHDGGDREMLDATHLTSSGSYREQLVGFKSAGSVTLEVNFIPASHADLESDDSNDTLRNFRFVLSDAAASYYAFAAYVKVAMPNAAAGEVLTGTITLTISGEITQGSDG